MINPRYEIAWRNLDARCNRATPIILHPSRVPGFSTFAPFLLLLPQPARRLPNYRIRNATPGVGCNWAAGNYASYSLRYAEMAVGERGDDYCGKLGI